MSKETDKMTAKRLLKIMKEDPEERKYKVTFKNMEVVLEKREYCNLVTTRTMIKKALAHEKKLKDSDEVTDTEVYKYLLCMACNHVMDMATKSAMQDMMHQMMGGFMKDQTESFIKELEKEDEDNA